MIHARPREIDSLAKGFGCFPKRSRPATSDTCHVRCHAAKWCHRHKWSRASSRVRRRLRDTAMIHPRRCARETQQTPEENKRENGYFYTRKTRSRAWHIYTQRFSNRAASFSVACRPWSVVIRKPYEPNPGANVPPSERCEPPSPPPPR